MGNQTAGLFTTRQIFKLFKMTFFKSMPAKAKDDFLQEPHK